MNIFIKSSPYIIAGPCGVEDEQQLMSVASALQSLPVDMVRGGVWKPRSKPGYFEGRGEPALQWMQQAKEMIHKPFCTEVASKEPVSYTHLDVYKRQASY